jgi:hypothetical protein
MSTYTIPTVVEKTRTGSGPSTSSRLLSERIIFLAEIDDGVANVVMAQLLHLDSERAGAGFDSTRLAARSALTAIYDTMRFIRSVATVCMGQASSAAAVLLAAGTPRSGRPPPLEGDAAPAVEPGPGALPDLAVEAGTGQGAGRDGRDPEPAYRSSGEDQGRPRPAQDVQRPPGRRLWTGRPGRGQPEGDSPNLELVSALGGAIGAVSRLGRPGRPRRQQRAGRWGGGGGPPTG